MGSKTYVSSVVYNLAGEESSRPNFLRTAIASAVIGEKDSIGEAIKDSYLSGPFYKLRNFVNWSKNYGYTDLVGLATSSLNVSDSIDNSVILTQLPITSGYLGTITSADVDVLNFTYWADQYVCENHPELFDTDYLVDIDQDNVITITYEDTSTESFTPSNFSQHSKYLYVYYNEYALDILGEIVEGLTIILGSEESFPDTTDWTENSYSSTTIEQDLDETTEVSITYSDSTPPSFSSSTVTTTESYDEIHGELEITNFVGSTVGGDAIYSIRQIMQQDQIGLVDTITTEDVVTEDIGGGVIKTTTTTVTTDIIILERSYKIDTQEIINKSWSPTKVFIYQQNTGNSALDSMFSTDSSGSDFFPLIPIRVNNHFISDTHPSDLYPLAKKALKKAINASYDKLEDNIKDNPSLGDIDFAYCVFGVSLNTKENSSKKYVYKFFRDLMENSVGEVQYDEFVDKWVLATNSRIAWEEWRNSINPKPGFEPELIPYPTKPTNRMGITTNSNPFINYNVQVNWNFINEDFGSGLLKPDAKAGDLWIESSSSPEYFIKMFVGRRTTPRTELAYVIDETIINWQVTNNSWKRLIIKGLNYANIIYGGHYVAISARDALRDSEESGFIIPLNEYTLKSLSVKDSTQVCTSCCYIVFNCYEVVKEKWYQTNLFKIFLIIVIIIITILYPPAGAGAKAAWAATGTALGLTGTTALVVGAIVNTIAGIIITKLITKAAIKLFGLKLGLIIGTIVSLVTLQVATGLVMKQTVLTSLNSMMQATSILKLTLPVGNAYSEYLGITTREIINESQSLLKDMEARSKEIAELYKKLLGDNSISIDPLILSKKNAVLGESLDSFLQRTLITGSDVVDISLDLLHNFTDVTLSLELN